MFRKTVVAVTTLVVLLAVLLSMQTPRVRADGTPTPEADRMHVEGTPEAGHDHAEGTPMADEHDHGARIDAHGATVKITSPADGATLIENSVIVRVETTNWPLGEGKHFHLYVNGKEQGMSQGTSNSLQARDLLTGANTLEVVLSNDLHQELDATHRIVVTVQPATATTAASSNSALIVAAISGAVVVIGGAALLLTRKK